MFKIIFAEIKKIVSKPGIYILSALLAVILVLGVVIYKPTVYESSQFELKGDRFTEKYTEFIGGVNKGKLAECTTNLDNSIKAINNYSFQISTETLNQKEYVEYLIEKYNEKFGSYQDCMADGSTDVSNERQELLTALTNLNSTIENAFINSQYGSYPIITSKANYERYQSAYKELEKWAKTTVKKENLKAHFQDYYKNYKDNYFTCFEDFKYPTLTKSFVKNYTVSVEGTRLYTLNQRLDAIKNVIDENYQKALTDSAFNVKSATKMDELANLYVNTVNTYTELIKYELITNAFSIVSTSEQIKLLHLSEISQFNSASLLERYSYLFKHNKSENDFGKPLTIGTTSNNEINAYDYSYFILRIFSFVIIVYAIMSACHTIAGEIKEGTMRYLAIRPVSRTKMFFGKWLAIILMSIILILFSLTISLCVGGAIYGFASKPLLSIFNGSYAFTIHPLGMIGIYLASMLFELIIYSLIAMLFSTLFKSDLLSMTILLVLYLLNTLIPIFVQGANTWLAFYPFSHISIYSLFGSSVYAVKQNFFNLVFGAKTYAGTHVALTASVITLIIVIVSVISVKIFKQKEL